MNISFLRLKPVVSELRGIRTALDRIAQCMEIELAEKGYVVRPVVIKPTEPSKEEDVSYVEEDMDWARENIEFYKREDKRKLEEQEQDTEPETGNLGVFHNNHD